MRYRIANEPRVSARVHAGPTDSQAEFERHVKTRGARSGAGQLNSRQIVNRITTLTHEGLYTIKSSRCVGDFQRCMRDQPKRADTDDVRKIQSFERCIVGKVQENPIPTDGPNTQGATFGRRTSCRQQFFFRPVSLLRRSDGQLPLDMVALIPEETLGVRALCRIQQQPLLGKRRGR